MSAPSPQLSSVLTKRFAYSACASLGIVALLLLPRTQHALPPGARPTHVAPALLRPPAILPSGAHDFWHTDGNRILDSHNRPVRISGMNWSGLETREAVPGGLETEDYRAILRTIMENGYNSVRIPFSNEMVETPIIPEHLRFSNGSGPINADLRDLTSLQILDKIVTYSGEIGLKVIFDNHRSEAGSSAEESGLWYTAKYPEAAWIDDWTSLTRRYQNNPAVIGMDLRNEPHNADKGGACWDCGGPTDWRHAAQRAGNAILTVNPRLLIFVEGVDNYAGDTYWWGGNLEGVRRSPVQLAVSNRLVYSAHEYGPTEYAQPWFNAATSSQNLVQIWRRHWAYISEAGIAPVWIGEFGTPNNDTDVQNSTPGSQGQWFTALVTFLGGHPALGWTYWGVNGEDRYGLLDAVYSSHPRNPLKAEALASIGDDAHTRMPAQTVVTLSRSSEAYASSASTFNEPAVDSSVTTQVPDQPSVTQAPQISMPALTRQPQSLALKLQKPPRHSQTSSTPSPSRLSVRLAIAASVQRAVSTANQSLGNEAARPTP